MSILGPYVSHYRCGLLVDNQFPNVQYPYMTRMDGRTDCTCKRVWTCSNKKVDMTSLFSLHSKTINRKCMMTILIWRSLRSCLRPGSQWAVSTVSGDNTERETRVTVTVHFGLYSNKNSHCRSHGCRRKRTHWRFYAMKTSVVISVYATTRPQ